MFTFICFAVNDCGYRGSRRDLIANWVHSLFFKAKSAARNEDNPSWRDAMKSPFKEELWKPAFVEVENLEGMDSWEVIDRNIYMNVL